MQYQYDLFTNDYNSRNVTDCGLKILETLCRLLYDCKLFTLTQRGIFFTKALSNDVVEQHIEILTKYLIKSTPCAL